MNHIKKQTVRDRFGNQVTYEFDTPKQVDPTAIVKQMMDNMGHVPQMNSMSIPNPANMMSQGQQQSPSMDHPGGPKGTDTVPAWLTPGEFVMNAEAVREFGPQIEAMNEHGREIQRAQGGTIPEYHSKGGKAKSCWKGYRKVGTKKKGGRTVNDCVKVNYKDNGGYVIGGYEPLQLPEDTVAKEKELMMAWKKASGSEKQAIKKQLDAHRKMVSPAIQEYREERLAEQLEANRNRGDDYDIPGESIDTDYPERYGTDTIGDVTSVISDIVTDATGGVISTDTARQRKADNALIDEVMSIELSPHSGLDEETRHYIEGTEPSPEVPKSGLEYSEDMMMIPGGENPETAEQIESSLFDESGEQRPAKFEFDGDFEAMRDGLIGAQLGVTEGVDEEGNPLWSVQGQGGKHFTTKDRTEAADMAAIYQGNEVRAKDPNLWNRVLTGFKDAFGQMLDEGELFKTALMYLGSRAMGYSHDGSLSWAGKQYINNIQAKQKAEAEYKAKLAEEQRAYNIKLAEEQRSEQRKIREEQRADVTARAKEKRADQREIAKYDIKKQIDARYDTPDPGDVKSFVNPTTGVKIQARQNPKDKLYYTSDADGNPVPVDMTKFEKFSTGQHGAAEVKRAQEISMAGFVKGQDRFRYMDEDAEVSRLRINPTEFVSAAHTHLNKTRPGGYLFLVGGEGSSWLHSAYEAANAWSARNKNKPIRNYDGFFSALNLQLYGADGHVNVHPLANQPNGEPIAFEKYKGLEQQIEVFRGNNPKVRNQSRALKIAIDGFEKPRNEFEKDLKAKVMEDIPKGSSPQLEFVKEWFNNANK